MQRYEKIPIWQLFFYKYLSTQKNEGVQQVPKGDVREQPGVLTPGNGANKPKSVIRIYIRSVFVSSRLATSLAKA